MTCIAGFTNNGIVVIGGDSAASAGWDLDIRKDPKVFKLQDFLIGYTTSFRMGQILKYQFKPPEFKEGSDPFEYMVRYFVEELRKTFKEYGFERTSNDTKELGGSFLVGFKGRLFAIDKDYQVAENVNPFAAVGNCREAIGALYSQWINMPDHHLIDQEWMTEAVREALLIASKTTMGVRGPFVIESIGEAKTEEIHYTTQGLKQVPFRDYSGYFGQK